MDLSGAETDDEDVQLIVLTPDRLIGQGVSGGDVHPFRTLDEAVRFAMEHLSTGEREISFIRTREGPLQAPEIERMYREMKA